MTWANLTGGKYLVRARSWGEHFVLHIFSGDEEIGITQVRDIEDCNAMVRQWLSLSGYEDWETASVVLILPGNRYRRGPGGDVA
jgi:hypothetical protein